MFTRTLTRNIPPQLIFLKKKLNSKISLPRAKFFAHIMSMLIWKVLRPLPKTEYCAVTLIN